MKKKMLGTASISLKNMVSDIEDKFKDIQKLEAVIHQNLN